MVADEAPRRLMGMDIEGADEELGVRPANHLVEIDVELSDGQAVIAEAAPPAARQVAPDLALLMKLEREAGILETLTLSVVAVSLKKKRKSRLGRRRIG